MYLLSLQTDSGDDKSVSMDSTLTFRLLSDINERGGNSVCSAELKSCRLIRSQLVQVEIDHQTVTPDSDGGEEGRGSILYHLA